MRFICLVSLILAAPALLGACDDATDFRIDPLLVEDTVVVYAPIPANADQPTALDITGVGAGVGGPRFPELASDAGRWDFAIRQRAGELVIVPAGALGIDSRAAITRPIDDETFESLREAPGRGSFVADSAVVLREGAVYAARSRQGPFCSFGGEQFAKLQPLELDVAAGRVRFQIVTNERCSDPRLVPEE